MKATTKWYTDEHWYLRGNAPLPSKGNSRNETFHNVGGLLGLGTGACFGNIACQQERDILLEQMKTQAEVDRAIAEAISKDTGEPKGTKMSTGNIIAGILIVAALGVTGYFALKPNK